MTDTTFSGPIQTGSQTIADGTRTIGIVPVQQRVSVSAKGVYAAKNLPACNISQIWANVEVAYDASANGQLRFGTSASVTQYGSVSVSAIGRYDATVVSGAALLALAEGTSFVVDVTAATVGTIGQASVYVQYHQS